MSKTVLEVITRPGKGKGEARKLRVEGRIPAVLYGHGQEALSISVDARAFQEAHAAGGNTVVTLQDVSGGTAWDALVKSVEMGRTRRKLLHIDFQKVFVGEKVKSMVPVRLEGDPEGVKLGGILQHMIWEVEVQALPADLPEVLTADITSLGMGDVFSVADLSVPAGVEILLEGDTPIVSVVATKAAASVDAALDAEGAQAAEASGESGS